jgi:hypothetical protein
VQIEEIDGAVLEIGHRSTNIQSKSGQDNSDVYSKLDWVNGPSIPHFLPDLSCETNADANARARRP